MRVFTLFAGTHWDDQPGVVTRTWEEPWRIGIITRLEECGVAARAAARS